MISQYERFVFLGELRLYTYRNLFPNDVPNGRATYDQLEAIFAKGNALTQSLNGKTLSVVDMKIGKDDKAELLFRIVDPRIPDNVLLDRQNGNLSVAKRKLTEDPAVSAHVLIDFSAKHDQLKLYPCAIENIDFLSRSLVISYLNQWMAQTLSQQKPRPAKKDIKTFQPRFEFVAPHSQTIENALDNGGVLTGMKWVEDRLEEKAFADTAYQVEKRSDVAITVKGRPTSDAAKTIISDAWRNLTGGKPDRFKITIIDGHERTKTIGIDPESNNVLSNLFIPQELITDFKAPVAMCEKSIRVDVIEKMKDVLLV